MNATDVEIIRLSRFLAGALPTWEDREFVAKAADLGDAQLTGSDSAEVWAGVLRDGLQAGRLDKLLIAAARRRPGHRGLARLGAAAEAGHLPVMYREGGLTVWLGLGGIGLALVLVAVAVLLGSSQGPALVVDGPDETEAPAPRPTTPATVAPSAPDPVPAPVPAAVPAPGAPPPVSFEDQLRGVPEVAVPAPAPSGPAGEPDGPCPGTRDAVVGYAWAGEASPGDKGDFWELDRHVNVRADFPKAENKWNSRAKTVCVIPPGAAIELVEGVMAIRGGAFWVPVVAGHIRMP